jgi:hypothetical protein
MTRIAGALPRHEAVLRRQAGIVGVVIIGC